MKRTKTGEIRYRHRQFAANLITNINLTWLFELLWIELVSYTGRLDDIECRGVVFVEGRTLLAK